MGGEAGDFRASGSTKMPGAFFGRWLCLRPQGEGQRCLETIPAGFEIVGSGRLS